MPYSHYHGGSYHTHRRRRKWGRHYMRHYRPRRYRKKTLSVPVVLALIAGALWIALSFYEREPAALNMDLPGRVVSMFGALVTVEESQQSRSGRTTVTLADAPSPTPVPMAASFTPQPKLALAPIRMPNTPIPEPTAKPEPTATPGPTSTPTPTSPPLPPHQRHQSAKESMLELINAERRKAEVPPVVLGANDAAQIHAESSLAHCTSGHWGADGLKPYMRYSLAGGYQYNAENGHGSDYCIKASDGYRALRGIKAEIQKAMDNWMRSGGHRETILDPMHRKVNIGLAWDTYNVMMYQHFEGDHIHYDQVPVIRDGVFEMSGNFKNGVGVSTPDDLGVMLHYDPLPSPLTAGQLARTYCYGFGRVVASLSRPLPAGSSWTTNTFTKRTSACADPYDVPADSPAPRSHAEANAFWEQAYNASAGSGKRVTAKWVTARKWDIGGDDFAVEADLRAILDTHGKGVYTVTVWAGDVAVSDYSIFHGITPPGAYASQQMEMEGLLSKDDRELVVKWGHCVWESPELSYFLHLTDDQNPDDTIERLLSQVPDSPNLIRDIRLNVNRHC